MYADTKGSDYTNLTSVEEQVLEFKNRPSLLLWYTADEPDGTQDTRNASGLAADLIHNIDPYHPVSLVLNCFDYYWKQYTARTNIILEDAYPIGVNMTWSFRGTEVRPYSLSQLSSFSYLMFELWPVHDDLRRLWV